MLQVCFLLSWTAWPMIELGNLCILLGFIELLSSWVCQVTCLRSRACNLLEFDAIKDAIWLICQGWPLLKQGDLGGWDSMRMLQKKSLDFICRRLKLQENLGRNFWIEHFWLLIWFRWRTDGCAWSNMGSTKKLRVIVFQKQYMWNELVP